MQYSEDYNTKDMEASFNAARLMYLGKVPIFETFGDFQIWYKVTKNHQKIEQLKEQIENKTI